MRTLLVFVAILLAGCQASLPPLPAWQSPAGREHADPGQIVDLHTGQRLSPQQLIEHLAPAPRVLVGEAHDNPDHHALQLWLLQALETQRAQGSLLLEMLTSEQQGRVDAVRARMAEGQPVTDLPAALAWQAGWSWKLYGPIVRHALAQPYPLLAANLNRAQVRQVYRKRPALSGALSTSALVQGPLLAQIGTSHCGKLPKSKLPAMLSVQQQRDRRMATALEAAPQPGLLFAGTFHVRRDLGVPLHLVDLGDKAASRVLILAEEGQTVSAAAADYVWYTPAWPVRDYCADFAS
ncbi:ChaN family lipoprotein [Pseudomonas sp. SA3-5]|uniref:ChaN family lipoprotein n=1 Tax=Pseudomonas aestuarii TaxID=3018340 RepID=A0ABT4XLQ3_9PSED|nr:ChaN family lipoprotein [Pseudomonas aestuarii]MDA7089151.1 ChaN family lipoprotein [Pseudomonas aestuarii]